MKEVDDVYVELDQVTSSILSMIDRSPLLPTQWERMAISLLGSIKAYMLLYSVS
jgi:wyosine [tRNA(Phe)-imidazoG37] synthetase (radical SAM superfamily)